MSDELMRKLRALADGCEAMCFGVEGNPREMDFMAADAVEEAIAEIERLRAERRWVPVTERLPERRQSVLVFSPLTGEGPVTQAWLSLGDKVFLDLEEFSIIGVTHWMPLPEPPTSGEVGRG